MLFGIANASPTLSATTCGSWPILQERPSSVLPGAKADQDVVDVPWYWQYSAGMDAPKIEISPELVEYATQKFLRLFGKDFESKELTNWFRGLQETAIRQTATVHCVGMRSPLPFEQIYQPNRLLLGPDPDAASAAASYAWSDKTTVSILRGIAFGERSVTVEELLRRDQDAFIFGGPGWGKTTFLHYVFRSTVNNTDILPVLISLRRPTAVEDLERYVEVCAQIQRKQHRACTLLLVDGYDEVNNAQRRRVSEALLKFHGHAAGKFYLTCRDYYQICELKAPEVRLGAFTRDDQLRFVRVFLSAFSAIRQDTELVVAQLEQRGFKEFLSHPLLLTLACIVQTTSTTAQPRSALRLLERAMDVLCFSWDEQKAIDRQRSTGLDGQDRIRILKQIAYKAKSPFVRRYRAEETAKRQLVLLGWDKVDPHEVLIEIARFYGILVPTEDGYEFVHRTIHDFLAAKQWVESGEFAQLANRSNARTKYSQPHQEYEWNARTGYAACLLDDATEILKQALASHDGLPALIEIIGNQASFDNRAIAEALIIYFKTRVLEYHRDSESQVHRKYAPRITGRLEVNFVRLANSRFLDFLVEYCCDRKSQVADLLVAYAATELHERRLKLSFQTYEKALKTYKTDIFTFAIPDAKQTQLGFLNPVLQNRMKDYKFTSIEK